MSELNRPQREAIRYTQGPLLVLAGAGSGKTRVITRKIVHLVEREGLAAHHIAAVTFTNKAAREMRSRVGELLRGRELRGLRISTFHTLGLNILRSSCKELGFKPGFSLFDDLDSGNLLREQLKCDNSAEAGAVQWRISAWKNDMITPQQALGTADSEQEARAARAYLDYQRALRAYNAVDFDDLIMLPVQLFAEQHPLLERWQGRIRHLLVDEYQDTNLCQYQLVRQLCGIRQALTVVGDDDQSIYSWRGARPENLAQLQRDFPTLKVIKLEQNYRCSGHILSAANHLIGHNPHLFDKRLWSDLGPGDPVRVMACKNERHEAEKVVSEIVHQRFVRGNGNGDYAILYRGNHQAKLFETVLRQQNIPYFLSGGTSFFSRSEIKDVLAYLRLLVNPDDDTAFLRVVNTPRREIGATTLERLGSYASERHGSLLSACTELGLEQQLGGRHLQKLREFSDWLLRYRQRSGQEEPVALVRSMLADLDFESWIYQQSRSDAAAERSWSNVQELLEWLQRVQRDSEPSQGLAEVIRRLALQDVMDRQENDKGSDQVHLMTLHSAKGLEFPHVFLVGMEEELLPHRSSIEEQRIDEERRLAYVGITRARKTLTISYARKRKRFGELISCEPSRFLDELPQQELNWEGRDTQRTQEERRSRGNAHLASIRSMLG